MTCIKDVRPDSGHLEQHLSDPESVKEKHTNCAVSETAHLVEILAGAGQRDYTRLDLSELARITRTPLTRIRSRFSDTDEWVDAYYVHLTERYRAMVGTIPDYHDYPVGEKLLNFFLTSLDMMHEHEPFVRTTYHPFIIDRFTSTRFEQSVARLFQEFTEQDGRVALAQQMVLLPPVYTWWSREYLHLTSYRLSHPESGEKVLALAEKTTGLLNDFLYNGVFDSSLDLGKYLIQNGFVSIRTPVNMLRKFLRF